MCCCISGVGLLPVTPVNRTLGNKGPVCNLQQLDLLYAVELPQTVEVHNQRLVLMKAPSSGEDEIAVQGCCHNHLWCEVSPGCCRQLTGVLP